MMRFLAVTILWAIIISAPMSAQERLLCPVCVKKDLKSTVWNGMTMCTTMGWSRYWDEDGNYHSEDPNTCTTSYSCSQGHAWGESCQGGSCKQSITKDNEAKLFEVCEGCALFGDEAVIELGTIELELPPPDPNEGRVIEILPKDGKIVAFVSVNEGFKIYPDDGPHIAIHEDCSVSINRNSSLEKILAEFAKLIASANFNLIEHLCFPK